MFLQSSHMQYILQKCVPLLFLACMCIPVSFAQGQDEVGGWLRRMECYELLALHLEKQLKVGTAKEQAGAAQDLADLYASMLGTADEDTRTKILRNAKSLIEREPALATTDLKLQLLRGSYLAAEQVVEQYRFRVVSPESHAAAINQLREVHSELTKLRPKLMESLRASRGKIGELRARNAGLSTTLLGWSGYYLARHDRTPDGALNSAKLFAEVLQSPNASLQEVSTDLRVHEYGARALLGIALCKEVANDPAGSDPWLEELEKDDVWAEIKRQIPLWRLHILIDAKRWDSILTLMQEDKTKGGFPDYWLLLIASRSLEDSFNVNADLLSAESIERLVKLGQLNMVSGLVDRYGERVLSKTNFVGKYILADLQFQSLRKKWDGVSPSTDSDIVDAFTSIAILLQNALDAKDAGEFPYARSNCEFLLAHSQYQARMFSSASSTFYQTADGARLEEGLWMTIICLNQLKTRSFEQDELRDLAIEQYITAFPSSERASQLKVHRSFDESQDLRSLDELLAIPHHDPMYDKARSRAEDLLYIAWRSSALNNKVEAGSHYLEISRPLLYEDAASTDTTEAVTLKRARRILDVALHAKIQRTLAAENVFALLLNFPIEDELVQQELLFRQLQLLLLKEGLEEAMQLGATLREESPLSIWNNHASVALINAMRDASLALRETLKHDYFNLVSNYIQTCSDTELSKPSLFGLGVETVENGLQLWQDEQLESTVHVTKKLTNRLLQFNPQNRSLLRSGALIEETIGDVEVALQHWRVLSNGLQKGTLEWFEARYKCISLVSDRDRERGNKMLSQYLALYPTYGMPPFDKKFKELESRLDEEAKEVQQ